MMANCFFKVTMKNLKRVFTIKVSSIHLNLNPWKSRLQAVNPIGGRVARAHLNIHIQGMEARTRVAFSPEYMQVKEISNDN